MALTDILRRFVARLLPAQQPPPPLSVHGLPPSIGGQLDADAIMGICRDAESGHAERLLRLYAEITGGDASIYGALLQRKTSLLNRPRHITPAPDSGALGEAKARAFGEMFDRIDGLRDALLHLMDATIWPVAVVRKIYRPSTRPGLLYELARLEPIPFYRLDFTGGGVELPGTLRLKCIDAAGNVSDQTEPVSTMEYIVHRGHMLKSFPDCWGGPLRACLFWWFFAAATRQWWARALNKFGTPFMVGRFQSGDDRGKSELLRAFADTQQLLGVVVSQETTVDVHQTLSAATTDSFEKFHKLCRSEIAKLILGQTMTTEGQPAGIGGTQANVQSSKLDDITEYDDAELAETIRAQIIVPWEHLNALPAGGTPSVTWAADTEDAALLASVVQQAHASGLALTENGLDAFNRATSLEFAPAAPALPPPVTRFAAGQLPPPVPVPGRVIDAREANDAILRDAAADLAQAFRGDFAPLRHMIRDADSPEELIERVQAFYSDWTPARSSRILSEALTAHAANGLLKGAR